MAPPRPFAKLASKVTTYENLELGDQKMVVIIYTKPGCPYCEKAREHYTARGIPFEDRNAQDNLEYRREMFSYSKGDPTVPTIVEDGKLKSIGWEGRG